MEYVDIYDRDKKNTGIRVPRRGYFLHENQYILIVICLVERDDGRFLITRRTMDKHWAAGWWEAPGGGVQAGETSWQAVVRETREETGLDISGASGGLIYTYFRENLDQGDNYFVDIYHYHMDFDVKDVVFNPREVMAFQLMTWDEMTRLNGQGVFLHYDRLKEALEQEARLGVNPGCITRIE